jgi:hypothetical protein
VFQGLTNSWQVAFPDISNIVFTNDSKNVVFINQHDSLCILTLGSSALTYVPNVKSFKLFKKGAQEQLIYHLKDLQLVIFDLTNDSCQFFKGVIEYALSSNGNALVLKKQPHILWKARITMSLASSASPMSRVAKNCICGKYSSNTRSNTRRSLPFKPSMISVSVMLYAIAVRGVSKEAGNIILKDNQMDDNNLRPMPASGPRLYSLDLFVIVCCLERYE